MHTGAASNQQEKRRKCRGNAILSEQITPCNFPLANYVKCRVHVLSSCNEITHHTDCSKLLPTTKFEVLFCIMFPVDYKDVLHPGLKRPSEHVRPPQYSDPVSSNLTLRLRRRRNGGHRQGRSQGGGGNSGHAPQRPITGANIYFPPKPKPGPLDQLGPQAKVDFFHQVSGPREKHQGSAAGRTRAPRDGSGPTRRIRAPQDRSGPAGRIRVPRDKSGPTERIRASRDGSGPRGTEQCPSGRSSASQDGSGPRRTRQVSARPIRASPTEPGPAGRSRSLQNEAGPRKTNESGSRVVIGPGYTLDAAVCTYS